MDSIITSCITLDMRISPIEMLNRTRETDEEKTLIPNYAMKNIIEKWLNENKK